MTQSEDIFDAIWDGIEEGRCRLRFGRKIVSKAVMTSNRKSNVYTDNGVGLSVVFSVKFRIADFPKIEQKRGDLCEVERDGVFEKYRMFDISIQGGIAMVGMVSENG